MLRKGHELGQQAARLALPLGTSGVAEAERRRAGAERLTVVLKGEATPKDNAERLALARMCQDTKRYAAAARFWAEALESDPKLGDDLQAGHRHHATGLRRPGRCRSGAGRPTPRRGRQGPAPRPGPRLVPRRPRAVLEKTRRRRPEGPRRRRAGPPALEGSAATWPASATPTALAKLPEPERKEWQSLWADVDSPAQAAPRAAVNSPVGRPATGRKRSARRQVDPGDSTGPGRGRGLRERRSRVHRARDRGPRDLRGGGRSFACRCPDAHPQRGLLRRAGQGVGPTGRVPAAGIPSGPDHSVGTARLGRVRRRGPPPANDQEDGLGRARARLSSTVKSPLRRSRRRSRWAAAQSIRHRAGLEALTIPSTRTCPVRVSSPRPACHRPITTSTSRRLAP